jgi:zinc D-Ala-D-Ala carboxypeptidase
MEYVPRMKLVNRDNASPHFKWAELYVTNTGLRNFPSTEQMEKLLYLAWYVLEPIREQWGPIKVTSGFRSGEVNRAIKGSPTSQHCDGEAADIVFFDASVDISAVHRWIVTASGIPYGQCIDEQKKGAEWIHISLPRLGGKNNEALTYKDGEYRIYQP